MCLERAAGLEALLKTIWGILPHARSPKPRSMSSHLGLSVTKAEVPQFPILIFKCPHPPIQASPEIPSSLA